MISNILRHYGIVACSFAIVCALATSCSDEEPVQPVEEPQPEVTEVALAISLGSDWSIDIDNDDASRAAPPGGGGNNNPSNMANGDEETKNVDKVWVVTFRRQDPDNKTASAGNTVAVEEEPFIYDATNEMVLDVQTGFSDVTGDKFTKPHRHRFAEGKLKKVYGFEYRVVAIAYDSKLQSPFKSMGALDVPDGENSWFFHNLTDGTRIEDFKATIRDYPVDHDIWRDFYTGNSTIIDIEAGILSDRVAQIPQLFFGECYTEVNGSNSAIIKYAVTNSAGDQVKDLPVTGILYRGLAKVELRITPTAGTGHKVEWISLMADNVFTTVGLSDYDDFLKPSKAIREGLGEFTPLAYCKVDDEEQKVLTAYMLPCKTRLAVRIKTGEINGIRNAQLTFGDTEASGTGIGIISPDVHDNVFYLRRNHKYVLTVNNSEKLLTDHKL